MAGSKAKELNSCAQLFLVEMHNSSKEEDVVPLVESKASVAEVLIIRIITGTRQEAT